MREHRHTGFFLHARYEAFAAAHENVVYVGSGDGNVYALNATDGSKLWNFTAPRYRDTGWVILSSPAVDNGAVYIGSFYGCLYAFVNSDPPAIPEFQSWVTLPVVAAITLVAAVANRKMKNLT
ncbi:MAG: PQQ-binding-like beta-propeller repeat protein [Pseudolabrys sp.]